MLLLTFQDPILSSYAAIILDEAHERSVNTDIMFGLLKQTVKKRPSFRLLITSATLDAEKFSEFFGKCPVINVPGRMHPVEAIYVDPLNAKAVSGTGVQVNHFCEILSNELRISILCLLLIWLQKFISMNPLAIF